MNIAIDHPTDRPNFTLVTIGPIELAFSYRTVIGFRLDSIGPWVTRPNEWGPTTGRHLAWLGQNPSRAPMIDADRFKVELARNLENLGALAAFYDEG